jgi:hypothetical protein
LLAILTALTIGGARIGTEILREMGVPADGARQIALASVATIPPIVLAGVVVVITDTDTSRLFGLGGTVLALAGIAIGLPFGFHLVGPIVALFYGGGLLIVLLTIGRGLLHDEDITGGTSGGTGGGALGESIGYVDSDSTPADGGVDDSELTFLLDEEE